MSARLPLCSPGGGHHPFVAAGPNRIGQGAELSRDLARVRAHHRWFPEPGDDVIECHGGSDLARPQRRGGFVSAVDAPDETGTAPASRGRQDLIHVAGSEGAHGVGRSCGDRSGASHRRTRQRVPKRPWAKGSSRSCAAPPRPPAAPLWVSGHFLGGCQKPLGSLGLVLPSVSVRLQVELVLVQSTDQFPERLDLRFKGSEPCGQVVRPLWSG